MPSLLKYDQIISKYHNWCMLALHSDQTKIIAFIRQELDNLRR